MPKMLIPMVLKPSVRPLKYYDIVGDLMLSFLANRRITIIKQVGDSAVLMTKVSHEDGSRLPIIINDKDELIRFVKIGGIDFMASVNTVLTKGIDTVIIDVKGGRKVWMHDRGLELMDLMVAAVRAVLEYVGLANNAVVFDGMNGFKVMALLTKAIGDEEMRALVGMINEVVSRSMKSIDLFQTFGNDVIIGGNTMLKVKMYRVPLSLHWSTKLSAIPVARVYDFITFSADPSNVIRRLDINRKLLEPLFVKNPVDQLLDSVGRWLNNDYSLIYYMKGIIRGLIRGGDLEIDRENLKTR
ncbi:hypothetical protein [Vulcanisaeta souniana]|uniref:Uncharacterized protein n=1 Tax=Vulcanisaeta souniana JCM 11219 TaxID=1293586 RepID=A0A830E1V2_9CREN|nr:hypothetical protein [Vulcanisaeta souniana]BDR93181.1 hypothetical protein Vsou_22740 [Vulcanisaeta souniana JCM 11219]GGI78245.1 hypothetical protein GCM10007112_13830 [Vulcanisaeta souniana JCM 11219]